MTRTRKPPIRPGRAPTRCQHCGKEGAVQALDVISLEDGRPGTLRLCAHCWKTEGSTWRRRWRLAA
jgi:hypothetical protein